MMWHKCPACNWDIGKNTNPCPKCKSVLDWRQIPPTVYIMGDPPPAISLPGAAPIAHGGIICANCGRQIFPTKSSFGWGWFILWLLLWVIPAIIYLIYYFAKRPDTCPVCEKNAYIKG